MVKLDLAAALSRKRLPDTLIEHGPTVRDEYRRLWIAHIALVAEVERLQRDNRSQEILLHNDHRATEAEDKIARIEALATTLEDQCDHCKETAAIVREILRDDT